jgi:hypothetical protein
LKRETLVKKSFPVIEVIGIRLYQLLLKIEKGKGSLKKYIING